MKTRVWSVFTLILILLSGSAGITQEIALDDKIIARLGEILSERKLANAGIQTRGSGEIFSKYLNSVPLVISAAGTGSSAVIRTSLPDSTSLVVTNHHVITSQFTDNKGGPFVLLLFYEPQLASEPLDRNRIESCGRSQNSTAWCKAFQQSLRPAVIIGSDPSRDLALMLVHNIPKGAVEIPFGQIDAVKPGDDVFVVGHPFDLLWSVTTGIVSAIRKQYPIGNPPNSTRSTVIQTQTPINPGNSGGPMINPEGSLVGLIFAQRLVQANPGSAVGSGTPTSDIRIAAPGINFAIGVNEVQSFVAQLNKGNKR
jgi:S1-C subfamily serine protease